MELQQWIDNNKNDYIKQFKKNGMYVRTYSKLNLALVKMHRNKNYDLKENVWMKYCRGAIINTENNTVVCVPPMKSEQIREVNMEQYDDSYSYEPLIDGTMINVFHHKGEWMLSTRSNIGGKNSWDGKVPFYKLFYEVNGNEWLNNLKKDHSYSFLLQHKKNRIVTPLPENMIYLIEMHQIKGKEIIKIATEELDIIDGLTNIFSMKKNDVYHYLNCEDLVYSVKGFIIKKGDSRIKWINPNYEAISNLKSNFNNKFLSYVSLRQEWKLVEYLRYFPEERYIFEKYKEDYMMIKHKLYESYVSVNITKTLEKKDVFYPLKPLVDELHRYYLKTKHKVNMSYINDYMQSLPPKRLLFIYNYFN